MSNNINSNQFFNNFQNGLNQINTLSVNNAMFNQNVLIPQPLRTPLEVLFPKYIAQLENTTAQLESMNQEQTIKMVKELFNMPKNMEEVLPKIIENIKQNNQQLAFLLLGSKLSFTSLADMLQTASKEANTKLFQMLAQFNKIGVSFKDEQLTEITKLINFVSATSTNDVQNVKTLMLMYLPWLPLTDPNAFKLEIANKGGGSEKYSDDFVTILISTENYGNLQADIYKTDADGIKILLITSKTFPQNNFVDLMKEESIKYSININIELASKEAFNKEKNEQSQTKVSMNVSPGVNPFLLLMSNALIKNVHFIDSKANLTEQRREKL